MRPQAIRTSSLHDAAPGNPRMRMRSKSEPQSLAHPPPAVSGLPGERMSPWHQPPWTMRSQAIRTSSLHEKWTRVARLVGRGRAFDSSPPRDEDLCQNQNCETTRTTCLARRALSSLLRDFLWIDGLSPFPRLPLDQNCCLRRQF